MAKDKKSVIDLMEEAEKKARARDLKLEQMHQQLKAGGFSSEEQALLLQALQRMTGDEYGIYKKRKPTDRVKFVQIIMDNITFLIKIRYLDQKEEAFLFKLAAYLEFKTNVIIQQTDKDDVDTAIPATPSYLVEQFGVLREYVSRIMNSLLKKGILGVAEAGMITEDGRACSSRTWFVNPNIMCCSPKDGVYKILFSISRCDHIITPYLL